MTARETGQRDRWLGKEVGFIDKRRCQDTMRSKGNKVEQGKGKGGEGVKETDT